MQTSFTLAQLADPDVAESEKILRACVHCGFCTATCPTYVLVGNELDSPRGRIYLIKDMLENDRPATAEVVLHIDRCLSCLACMTTCPSGVHYMHLVDHARAHIEKTYRRPRTRAAAAHRARKAFALSTAIPVGPCGGARRQAVCPACRSGRAQAACSHAAARPGGTFRTAPLRRKLPGRREQKRAAWLCSPAASTTVLAPQINAAAIRVLTRHGIEVVVAEGAGLLRLARPSHGPGRGGAQPSAPQYRCLDARSGRLDAMVMTPPAAARP